MIEVRSNSSRYKLTFMVLSRYSFKQSPYIVWSNRKLKAYSTRLESLLNERTSLALSRRSSLSLGEML
jgi:hypothetical protein